MPRSCRERLLLIALSGVASLVACSRLTAIDWSLIKPAVPASGGTDAVGSGGEAPENLGGSPAQNEAGQAGETAGGEGGEESFGGSSAGTSFGGTGGATSTGGVAGGGGMAGNAGGGGTAGSGGGSSLGGAPPCTGTISPVMTTDLVLFDGGPGKRDTAWGGRAQLDQACASALGAFSPPLPQTKTHALIATGRNDAPADWITAFPDIAQKARIVGPTGIELATNYPDLLDGSIEQSLVCASVTPPDVKFWLTGSNSCYGLMDSPPNNCLKDSGPLNNCNDWTLGSNDPDVLARYGHTVYADRRWILGDVETRPFSGVTCNALVLHIICLGYTPLP